MLPVATRGTGEPAATLFPYCTLYIRTLLKILKDEFWVFCCFMKCLACSVYEILKFAGFFLMEGTQIET